MCAEVDEMTEAPEADAEPGPRSAVDRESAERSKGEREKAIAAIVLNAPQERLCPPAGRRARCGASTTSIPRRCGTDRCCRSSSIACSLSGEDLRQRLTDSIETAYLEGGGAAWAVEIPRFGIRNRRMSHLFSERFECRQCGIAYEDPQPRLFSFNNPFGACPTCHGFGNIIELDMDLVVPDPTKSIQQGAIEPWSKPHYRAQLAELKRAARKAKIRLDVPWSELTDEEKRFVVEGGEDDAEYGGVRGFFRWLERKKYKVHVRVFLSRYRGYLTCPDCGGARLRREARDVRVVRPHDRSGVVAHRSGGAGVLRTPRAVGEGKPRSPRRC